jgi:hypothetical protein
MTQSKGWKHDKHTYSAYQLFVSVQEIKTIKL